jgi:NAD(P)-dependent dehydrogenase (short-subunit alcohol dehydrogenase family)
MARRLEGRIAVVTGGTTGIGLATGKRFAAEGARVFVTGRRQAELNAAVAAIGPRATGVQADSANPGDLNRLYERVKTAAGRIDVLFVNAGGGSMLPLGSITEEQYDDTFGRNVKGALFTVQKALPLLAQGASVILTGSIASLKGFPSLSVYNASKAAVRSFARSWIADLKGRGIRVNVLSPGHVDTPGLSSLMSEAEKAAAVALVPLGRIGTPDDLGKAAVFLASDDSAYVTGIELFVDGGVAQI